MRLQITKADTKQNILYTGNKSLIQVCLVFNTLVSKPLNSNPDSSMPNISSNRDEKQDQVHPRSTAFYNKMLQFYDENDANKVDSSRGKFMKY